MVLAEKELSLNQQEELTNLKRHFPFRIVFAAVNSETGEVQFHARNTRRKMNYFLRKGWKVFVAT